MLNSLISLLISKILIIFKNIKIHKLYIYKGFPYLRKKNSGYHTLS